LPRALPDTNFPLKKDKQVQSQKIYICAFTVTGSGISRALNRPLRCFETTKLIALAASPCLEIFNDLGGPVASNKSVEILVNAVSIGDSKRFHRCNNSVRLNLPTNKNI
jgi:hypothetical protein